MSDKDETESSTSSDDDGPPEISENFEKSFFRTLSSLKNDDPTIYDSGTRFFDPNDISSGKTKVKKSKKDNLANLNLINGEDNENDNVRLPYNVEQRQIKDSLTKFVNDSDDEDDLLVTSKKSQEQIDKEEADYIQWLKGQKKEIQDKNTEESLKNLREYWNSNLDDDEAYLRDYILNKKFLDKDESENEEFSDDSEELEQMEEFEKEYNFRYENEENLIRRFPRNVDTSVRRKDSKRSEKRKEIKERKKLEKSKKQENINRQKNLKAKEIAERLEKLKELTGNEKLAFSNNDIIEDFNSEEFDKKMNSMFGDDYYQEGDDEKPGIDDLDFGNDYGEQDDGDYGEQEGDYDEAGPSRKERKKTRTKRKKERKKKSFMDIADIEKPVYDPKLHQSYQKYMDEYYSLDCEDFIEDIPCRFKYREVEPNDYGLSIEEILMADDKELNAWSSVKNMLKLRPAHVERNHAMQYKKKASNEAIKRKILPSLFKEEEVLIDNKKKSKKNKDSEGQDNNEEMDLTGLHSSVNEEHNKDKSKKKNKPSEPNETENNSESQYNESDNSLKNKKDKRKKIKSDKIEDNFENNNDDDSQNIVKEIKSEDFENGETFGEDSDVQKTEIMKNKKRKKNKMSDDVEANIKQEDGGTEEFSGKKGTEKRKRQENDESFPRKKSQHNSDKNRFNKKFNKFNKKNHDFHDTRLSAYGLNPKKFKVRS